MKIYKLKKCRSANETISQMASKSVSPLLGRKFPQWQKWDTRKSHNIKLAWSPNAYFYRKPSPRCFDKKPVLPRFTAATKKKEADTKYKQWRRGLDKSRCTKVDNPPCKSRALAPMQNILFMYWCERGIIANVAKTEYKEPNQDALEETPEDPRIVNIAPHSATLL